MNRWNQRQRAALFGLVLQIPSFKIQAALSCSMIVFYHSLTRMNTAPCANWAVSYIVIPNGLLFGVPVVILIFTGQGRLSIRFCFSDFLRIGLAVLRHGMSSSSSGIGAECFFFDIVLFIRIVVFQWLIALCFVIFLCLWHLSASYITWFSVLVSRI